MTPFPTKRETSGLSDFRSESWIRTRSKLRDHRLTQIAMRRREALPQGALNKVSGSTELPGFIPECPQKMRSAHPSHNRPSS